MKKQNDHTPPRWAQRFLAWYCRAALLEDLQGDLNEYFQRNLREKGPGRAKLIYILDVLKFFRSYTLRTPKFLNLLIHWIMLGSYIKTSGRNIIRNKLFSSINIFGLAISMSVGLLMITFLSDLLSYDAFHEKKDRIYRVVSLNHYIDRAPRDFASTSVKAGKKIKENFSAVEEVTILRRGFGGDGRYGEKTIALDAFWANETFFNVFTFPLVQGDPRTALKEPYSLVLTEKSARKLFGDETALGKSVEFDTINYVVTGVMKDVPRFSHLRFEALVSFSTVELQNEDDRSFLSWESIFSNYVYVLLAENADPQLLQSGLDQMSAEENAATENRTVTVSLQPLNNIVLGRDMSNIPGLAMPSIVLWVVGGLALIVIMSACFNYTNLSIARSIRRSREVGIRKTIGALKSHVMGQFICESVIIALLALVLSFLLFLLLRPQFLSIAPELRELVVLDISGEIIFYFVLMAIAVGIAAGFLPALFFSRVNAVQVLKDASSMMVFRRVNLRKALIVIQYTFSLIFIATTIIGYKQYRNFLAFDLGFNTENILNIRLEGNKGDLLIKQLAELPEVTAISKSLMVTSVGNYYSTQMKYNDMRDSSGVWFNSIDEMYLPLHGHQLVAGRNFAAKPGMKEENEVIVNEQVLKHFDIGGKDPQKALGEVLSVEGRKLTIIGVLRDFHYGKVDNPIDPVIFRYLLEANSGYVNVKINSGDWQATLMSIDNAWRKLDRVHPLNATFYDDQIEQAYSGIFASLKILGLLAMLAVCIASIGLMGMVVFTTETKLKEMSIRKVLGASQRNLIYLLSKGFLILLAIAALIALPATYFFFDKIALASFPYRAPITLMELSIGVLIVMGIAFLMIGTQTLKVARSNPAEVLKNE